MGRATPAAARSKSADGRGAGTAGTTPKRSTSLGRRATGRSPSRVAAPATDKVKNKKVSGSVRPKECQEAGCRKRLGLAAYVCRCGSWYCPLHVAQHGCSYDYHKAAKKDIKKSNPKVAGKKINKL